MGKRNVLVTNRATSMIQNIVVNVKPRVRYDTLEGKKCMVVPMVMLTEGVHAGSKGPLYYPPEELGKTPVVWNHKPIVIYHPTMNGQSISACDPDVINTRKVGVILNTRFQKGKLTAEAWLDPDRLKDVDSRVLNDVKAGRMVEVSTGLFTDNDDEDGTWNGEKYLAVARNFRPDHLAILPDQKGACSIADGAGLLRNSAKGSVARAILDRALVMVENELSHSELFERLNVALRKSCGGSKGDPAAISASWVTDVFDTYFIYSKDGKLYKQQYVNSGDNVSLKGTPVEVKRITVYEPVGSMKVNTSRKGKEPRMNKKKKMVNALIANQRTAWDEEDRNFLLGLPKTRLQSLLVNADSEEEDDEKLVDEEEELTDMIDEEEDDDVPPQFKKKKKDETVAENEDDEDEKDEELPFEEDEEEVTNVEHYISRAPQAIRDVLREGVTAHNAEKSKLVNAITANKANRFSKDYLMRKPISELRCIASLATNGRRTANFSGAADAGPVDNAGEEPLVAPVMSFEKR